MDSFEYMGHWRIPGNTQTIAGTLKFSTTQGGILELLGTFENINEISEATKHDIIHGFTPEGKFVTLYRCIRIATSLSQPGYFTSKYYVNVIFVGILFNTSEEISFDNVSINFLNLDEWLGLNFINYKQNKSKKQYSITGKIPRQKKFSIDSRMSLSIEIKLNLSTNRAQGTVKQTPYLKLEYSTEEHFDNYYKRIYELQNFLTFSMNDAIYPIRVLGISKRNKTEFQGQIIHNEIEIFYKTYSAKEQRFNPYLILFNYNEVSSVFRTIIKSWYKYAQQYQSIIDLYFGTFYQPEMYIIHRFLSLIYSLEGYHRLRFGEMTELPIDDYDKMIKDIFSEIKYEPYRKWLKKELTYANEITLRKRIKQIIKRLDIIDMKKENMQLLVDKIVNTRNYYSHYDDALKSKAAKANELHLLNNKLNILFQLSLMLDLKIPTNERIKDNLQQIFKEE